MTQTRLHLTLPRRQAEHAHAAWERAFEEDGAPLALVEADEAKDLLRVELYVEAEDAAAAARARAALAGLGLADAVEAEPLPEVDWVAKSLEGLAPVRAGRFLVHGAHDRARRRPGDIAIEIEAGLAFGTGHHGTTAGCLEAIDRHVRARRPRNVLDLGTGSGVLAIAIARSAHVPVLATDIDPVATRVAAANARLNGAARPVRSLTATGFAHREVSRRAPFDLIVANILARPLMRLAPAFARHLAPGGTLVLSGILATQRRAVIAAFAGQRFRHLSTLARGEWVTIRLARGRAAPGR